MAKKIPNVDILTETFDTWLNRTNSIIDILSSEVLTANATLGITGNSLSPVNSRLWGSFTANTLVATTSLSVQNTFSANTSRITINSPIQIGASIGQNGQVLISTGSGVNWSTFRVDTPANGGLTGGPISGIGSLSVKAGDGIVVDSRGVSANVAYIAAQIGGGGSGTVDWASPGAIGSATPNTGNFLTLTASSFRITGISSDNFLLDGATFRTRGIIDSLTPGDGTTNTTGGVRIRARGTGRAALQFTNEAGSLQYGFVSVDSTGKLRWSGDFETQNITFNGTAFFGGGTFAGAEVGYKTIPQIVTNGSITINPVTSSGAHHYKTTTSAINITIPDNNSAECPIGTSITIINDASAGAITLVQGSEVSLQLGGTLTSGNRTIDPGGVVTAIKVATNKWIVSGIGVA